MLLVSDVAFNTHLNPSVVAVTIKCSKSDPFRSGFTLFLGRTADVVCPVKSLASFLAVRVKASGPLFTFQGGSYLTRGRLVAAIRDGLSKCGIDPSLYNGHSFRIGEATTAAQRGIPDSTIQMLGRWQSTTLYICITFRPPEASLLVFPLNVMAAKRKLEFDVSSINGEVQSATVHGRVLELSPVKASIKNEDVKFFDCKLTDRKEVCRMVSFEPKVWSEIDELISVVNCGIKKSKMQTGYELVLYGKLSVISSPKQFKVNDNLLESKVCGVSELERIDMIENIAANVGNKVLIKRKILSLKNSETIKSANDRVFTK